MKSLPKESNKSKKATWTEKVIPDNFHECQHYFEFRGADCVCKKCGTGVIGVLEVKEGKIVM